MLPSQLETRISSRCRYLRISNRRDCSHGRGESLACLLNLSTFVGRVSWNDGRASTAPVPRFNAPPTRSITVPVQERNEHLFAFNEEIARGIPPNVAGRETRRHGLALACGVLIKRVLNCSLRQLILQSTSRFTCLRNVFANSFARVDRTFLPPAKSRSFMLLACFSALTSFSFFYFLAAGRRDFHRE